MADRDGNPALMPADCGYHPDNKGKPLPPTGPTCPNIKETSGNNMDLERYECAVCGLSYTLYYDEMK